MRLIALTGKAGCGKTTVANRLVRDHGFIRYSFATPLKDMLRAVGVDKDTPIPDLDVTPRYMMQTLGTDWGRKMIHPDIWVILARQHLTRMLAPPSATRLTRHPHRRPGVVIDDLRFDNEAELIHDLGGTVILLQRSDHHPDATVDAHASEAGIHHTLIDRIAHPDDV